MESITRVATTSHFLLMFGYKLFSFFFPLYLAQQGFSLPQVGYTYLLIYLPIALFAPIAGWLNAKLPPLTLALVGIVGYGAYSLALLLQPSTALFYVMQAALGVAAACFFVSTRSLLIRSGRKHPDQSFGYFYSAPNAAEAVAPAVGALLIFLIGFQGVFLASLAVHAANLLYLFAKQPQAARLLPPAVSIPRLSACRAFAKQIFSSAALPLLTISFLVVLAGGLYQPFFVIYLEHLGWSDTMILLYGAVFSAMFVPISYAVVRWGLFQKSPRNIYIGSLVFALGSILFGLLSRRLEFIGILALGLLRGAGGLAVNAGRSGYLSRQLSRVNEPAGVFDTMFSPLGVAFGALAAGFLLTRLDFASLFTQAGVLIAALVLFIFLKNRSSL